MGNGQEPLTFKQLEQYYDYTKWHVGLYAAGIAGTWFLKETAPGGLWPWFKVAGTILLVLAAACAGAICGTIPECSSLEELNQKPITILQIRTGATDSWWPTGKAIRVWEKLFFWSGVMSLLLFLFNAPPAAKDPPPGAACVCCKDAWPSTDNVIRATKAKDVPH